MLPRKAANITIRLMPKNESSSFSSGPVGNQCVATPGGELWLRIRNERPMSAKATAIRKKPRGLNRRLGDGSIDLTRQSLAPKAIGAGNLLKYFNHRKARKQTG